MPTPVLLVVRELGLGGSERQLTETAKHLDRTRFEPHVGCFRPEGIRLYELREAGVPVVRFPVRSFAGTSTLAAMRELGRYVRRHAIRLVHSFDVPSNLFCVPAARWARCPVVLSSQRAHRELAGPTYRRLLRLTDRMVDGIVVNCEAVRKHLVVDEGVPDRLIHVCHNGIDTSHFRPDGRAPEARMNIGIVCALRAEKGLATLMAAFGRVAQSRPDIQLLIVGSGPMEPVLRAQASALRVADKCHFEATTASVATWLRRIDIFVLPSLSEALSNSLMEAMASGCAVIASDVGGNPELVAHEQTGLLFRAGNADQLTERLRTLLDDPGLRNRLAANATRQIREHFTIQASVRRMGEVYEQMLAKTQRDRDPN